MFDFLEKLRQKPVKVKKQVAFFAALSFAGIIFVIWLSAIYPDIWKDHLREKKVTKLQPSPTESFTDILSQAFTVISEKLSEARGVISSFASSTEYYVNMASTSPMNTSSSPKVASSSPNYASSSVENSI